MTNREGFIIVLVFHAPATGAIHRCQCPLWVGSRHQPCKNPLSYSHAPVLASRVQHRKARLHLVSPTRRPRRPHEWTAEKAVTFIVTLAATGSVTLAARAAAMSRKSAYALKFRDRAFGDAWTAAARAAATNVRQGQLERLSKGDKVEEMEEPPVSSAHGDTAPSRCKRERAFTRLIAALRESSPLADPPPAQ
jgi:hypothetical protein